MISRPMAAAVGSQLVGNNSLKDIPSLLFVMGSRHHGRNVASLMTGSTTQVVETQSYEAISELMYRAVRIGGIPCTNQPWRWGYGWQQCR